MASLNQWLQEIRGVAGANKPACEIATSIVASCSARRKGSGLETALWHTTNLTVEAPFLNAGSAAVGRPCRYYTAHTASGDSPTPSPHPSTTARCDRHARSRRDPSPGWRRTCGRGSCRGSARWRAGPSRSRGTVGASLGCASGAHRSGFVCSRIPRRR